MPRTLTPTLTLTTTVGDTTRVPVIATTCEDHISRYNQLAAATTAQGQNFFNACIANDGSIIRVWVVPGSPSTSFQYQRITNPSIASQWTTWTTFGGTSGTITVGAACCVSNNSGTLHAFAQHVTGSNEIWTWSSTNNGVTWSASPSVVFTPLAGLSSARSLPNGFSSSEALIRHLDSSASNEAGASSSQAGKHGWRYSSDWVARCAFGSNATVSSTPIQCAPAREAGSAFLARCCKEWARNTDRSRAVLMNSLKDIQLGPKRDRRLYYH